MTLQFMRQHFETCCGCCVFLPCHLLRRHGDFVSRYKILLPREQQDIVLASEQQTRAAVLQLLAVFKVPDGQYEMGRTKVFFKPGGLSQLGVFKLSDSFVCLACCRTSSC